VIASTKDDAVTLANLDTAWEAYWPILMTPNPALTRARIFAQRSVDARPNTYVQAAMMDRE
jgi:hypothetical protein